MAQWDASRAISRRPGASARELATVTFQSEQAFGALVGRLTVQGLVERSPGHGRRIEHRLTPVGEQTLAASWKSVSHLSRPRTGQPCAACCDGSTGRALRMN
ncbi:MarR family transcriptional regulator [Stenotrophomonas sp. NPDC087984]